MIRALFLDAAGTLIEPVEAVGEVYARIATAHDRPTDPAAIGESFAGVFGGGLPDPAWDRHPHGDRAERDWWRDLVGRVFDRLDPSPWPRFDDAFAAIFDHYAQPAAWRLFPEVPAILTAARESSLLTAVVSNFDRRLHRILEGHGLDFDLVLTSADARARKPDPVIFATALEALHLGPDQAFHIGDSSRADLEGARIAGLHAFLIDRPGSDLTAAMDALSRHL